MQNLIDFDDDAKKENDNFLGMIQKIYSAITVRHAWPGQALTAFICTNILLNQSIRRIWSVVFVQ